MPYQITFELSSDHSAAPLLPPYPGRALHALFYQWLALGDYTLATDVHDDDGPRPFTVSPLYRRDGTATLRLTLLDEALWPALEQGIAKTPRVEILRQPFVLSPAGPEVQQESYTDLAAHPRSDTRLSLRFCSPTTFRSHEMHYPLPDPFLLYQSWLTRWNTFAPPAEQINVALLDLVAAHVALGRYTLRTEMVDLGESRKAIGFVGSVQLNVLHADKIGREWVYKLNLLADYAAYCGTGHKTAQGMGQTQRI